MFDVRLLAVNTLKFICDATYYIASQIHLHANIGRLMRLVDARSDQKIHSAVVVAKRTSYI